MGFKLFALVMTLLIPAVMLGFGYYWKFHPPKEINMGYGYRTKRSMFNQQTWDFAHKVCARIWRSAGWWTLIISVFITLPVLLSASDIEFIGIFCSVVVFLQIISLLAPLPITERALKRTFGI